MNLNSRKEDPIQKENHVDEGNKHTLILYNDDFNTFDHVIESLVEVCGHDSIQAEQCALLTHFKGSCEIKTGNLRILNSMCSGLVKRDLKSEIKS